MIKRFFDIVVSLLGLIFFLPILLLISILIWKYDKKSPFYISARVGKNNILFNKNKAIFIDWEFACVNDKFFDLATICIEFNLNKSQENILLKKYLKKVKKLDTKKLASYKIIYKNLSILWFKSLKKQ